MSNLKKLTAQQQEIISFPFDMKINACAGSGKTTTLIEYAAAKPPRQKGLYLAFNRSVRLEAQSRFAARGLSNIDIHTAHSLAYKHIVPGRYRLAAAGDISLPDIVNLFELRKRYDSTGATILAAHAKRFLTFYCNSEARQMADLDYQSTIDVTDKKAFRYVTKNYDLIEKLATQIFSRMDTGELAISHDFYLKKFQLTNPLLNYDYILFDEGQDASETMLNVFLSQNCTKVIVGDEHQQIYGFRYAVNSLQRVYFPTLTLTSSFRFDQPIAQMVNQILAWKQLLDADYQHRPIQGLGVYQPPVAPLHAYIGRTNLSVLATAIEAVCLSQQIGSVYFEGNFDTYTYMDSGGSLFDILNLHLGNTHLIRNALIQGMQSTDSLLEYIELTGEKSMKVALEIVQTYEEELPGFIQQIKRAHLADNQRQWADSIFTTVHRCKGMEYDFITVLDDFISLEKLLKKLEAVLKTTALQTPQVYQAIHEEINMLYVAVTRSKNQISIPAELRLALSHQIPQSHEKSHP